MGDFLPTINEITENQVKSTLQLDGKSYFNQIINPSEGLVQTRIIRHYCGTSLWAIRIIDKGEVYKVYQKYPKLNADGHCGQNTLCRCFGEDSTIELKNLLIFDLKNDPYENNPIEENSNRYNEIKIVAENEFKAALQEVHPPSQFLNKWDVMPRPWMQPCAN